MTYSPKVRYNQIGICHTHLWWYWKIFVGKQIKEVVAHKLTKIDRIRYVITFKGIFNGFFPVLGVQLNSCTGDFYTFCGSELLFWTFLKYHSFTLMSLTKSASHIWSIFCYHETQQLTAKNTPKRTQLYQNQHLEQVEKEQTRANYLPRVFRLILISVCDFTRMPVYFHQYCLPAV